MVDPRFRDAQQSDITLRGLQALLTVKEGQVVDPHRAECLPRIVQEGGLWFHLMPGREGIVKQALVLTQFREQLLQLAHTHAWVAHQGVKATLARITNHFFWPSVSRDVRLLCKRCEVCQRMSGQSPEKAPLCPLPVIQVPFERIALDFVGSLSRTGRGARYLLVIVDYAT